MKSLPSVVGVAAVVLTLNCASPLCAQRTDIPKFSVTTEGNSSFAYPFSFNQCRMQVVLDAAELGTVRVLSSVSMRPDGGGTTNTFQATTLNPTVRAYQVATKATTMTTNWANNIGSAKPTVLFQQQLKLPAFSVRYPLPNPHSIKVPFQRAYVFRSNLGNLLLDWQLTAASYTFSRYNVDAVTYPQTAGSLVSRVFRDTSCKNSRGDSLAISMTRSTGTLGGPLDVKFTPRPASGGKLDVLAMMLGATNKKLGGTIALPLSLGAAYPGCSLAIDPLLVLPAVPLTVPNRPTLADTQLYVQGFALDSTTADFVVSEDAWTLRILDNPPKAQGFQSVFLTKWTPTANQPTGFMSRGFYYAPVLRFD